VSSKQGSKAWDSGNRHRPNPLAASVSPFPRARLKVRLALLPPARAPLGILGVLRRAAAGAGRDAPSAPCAGGTRSHTTAAGTRRPERGSRSPRKCVPAGVEESGDILPKRAGLFLQPLLLGPTFGPHGPLPVRRQKPRSRLLINTQRSLRARAEMTWRARVQVASISVFVGVCLLAGLVQVRLEWACACQPRANPK